AVVLFAHGNAGNVADLRDVLVLFDTLDASVLAFDYRGYGRSGGVPTEAGVLADARAARRWLARRCGVAGADVVLAGPPPGGGGPGGPGRRPGAGPDEHLHLAARRGGQPLPAAAGPRADADPARLGVQDSGLPRAAAAGPRGRRPGGALRAGAQAVRGGERA